MDDTLTLTVGSKVVQVGDMLGVAVVRWAARKGTAQHEHRADTAHSTLLKRSAVSSQFICWGDSLSTARRPVTPAELIWSDALVLAHSVR